LDRTPKGWWREVIVTEIIYAEKWDETCINRLGERADRIIKEHHMREPILGVLFDGSGRELARWHGDSREACCDEFEAEARSQSGASLKLVDANGNEAEVVLIVGAVKPAIN
jgi:hypothetical protein